MFEKIKYLLNYFFLIRINPRIKNESFVFVQNNVKIIIEKGGILNLGNNVVLKKDTTLYVKKNAKLFIGNNSSTGHHTEISVNNNVTIGSNVLMSAFTYITDSNHSLNKTCELIKNRPMDIGSTKIGDNVWIGRSSIILKDVILGDNSVIGAGCVVTKSFPNNSLILGVPGKLKKYLP